MILKKVAIIFLLLVFILIIATSINFGKNKNQDKMPENINQEKGDLKENMKLIIGNETYEVKLDNNETVTDIINMLPLELTFKRYDNHEYYSDLEKTPKTTAETTSDLKAGHVYYWGGGNSFVINYIDYDISPYKSVHIGEITDKKVVDILKNSPNNVSVKIEK